MRVLVDIGEEQLKELDRLAKAERTSRAALIRHAIDEVLQTRSSHEIDSAFGLWGDRRVDGLDYQERLRDEW